MPRVPRAVLVPALQGFGHGAHQMPIATRTGAFSLCNSGVRFGEAHAKRIRAHTTVPGTTVRKWLTAAPSAFHVMRRHARGVRPHKP